MEWEQWKKEVLSKCKVAISYCRSSGYLFSHRDRTMERGKFIPRTGAFVANTRKDRRPLDTITSVHRIINKWLKMVFGWKARSENVLFVEGNSIKNLTRERWRGKGELVVFPVGNFRYIWSPEIQDMTGDLEINREDIEDTISIKWEDSPEWSGSYQEYPPEDWTVKEREKILKEKENSIIKALEESKYTNKNMAKAIRSGNEIMINCKQYYALAVGKYDGREFKEGIKELIG